MSPRTATDDMSPERWERAKELFALAVEIPVAEVEQFLLETCPDDLPLRRYVLGLLGQYRGAGSILDTRPAVGNAAATVTPRFRVGDRVYERFVILRFLGEGGMGEVYAAEDETLKETVALKVLRSELSGRPGALGRFRSEVRRARKVTHANVCRVHELFEASVASGGPCVFLTMELLQGETLSAKLKRDGKYSAAEGKQLLRQIAAGLDAAHAQGIIHRDLKPGNIFLVDEGKRAIITDFGLAGVLDGFQEPGKSMTRELGGTPGYMAPEQMGGGQMTGATDIYALAVVVREMCEAGPGWDERIGRGLEYDPAHRPASAEAFIGSLPETHLGMSRRWLLGAGATAGGVLAAAAIWKSWPAGTDGPEVRIAVLPFENQTGKAELGYVGDGLTEQVILGLQRNPQFWVAGRNSVFRFPAGSLPARELARQLNVSWLVMGAVGMAGERLKVNARLISASGGAGPWSVNLDRERGAVSQVTVEIVEGLRQTLAPSASKAEVKMRGGTENAAALDAYMRGRQLWNRRTPADLRSAITLFEEAAAIDRDFALAHCGIADALSAMADNGAVSPAAEMSRAKGAALEALRADSRLGHAHATFALVTSLFDLDLATAEISFRRALEMDPFDATAHHWYAALLLKLGRFGECVQEAEAAFSRDSLSLPAQFARAGMYYFTRRYEETISLLREIQTVAPEYWQTHEYLAECHARLGNREGAIAEARLGVEKSKHHTHSLVYAGTAYAILGMRTEAEAMASRVEKENQENRYFQPLHLARIYAEMHDEAQANRWIERMIEQRDTGLGVLAVHHSFDWLRRHGKLESTIRRARVIYPGDKIPNLTLQRGQG